MLRTAKQHGFHFDAVQMPINVMDAHFDSFAAKVVPVAVEQGIGVLGMKPLGSGVFFKSKALGKGGISPTECLQYPMGLPTSVVITGCDELGVLMQALDAALRFDASKSAGKAAAGLLQRTADDAKAGEWEKYKTEDRFDGTAQHPWWMETASLKKPA
jgi:hypothetical protein